jgi:hypothetical protein
VEFFSSNPPHEGTINGCRFGATFLERKIEIGGPGKVVASWERKKKTTGEAKTN